jgi:hypothetical protein
MSEDSRKTIPYKNVLNGDDPEFDLPSSDCISEALERDTLEKDTVVFPAPRGSHAAVAAGDILLSGLIHNSSRDFVCEEIRILKPAFIKPRRSKQNFIYLYKS